MALPSLRPRPSMSAPAAFLSYERSRFSTRLPLGRLYTGGHLWLLPEEGPAEPGPGLWRIGFTKFALRMLGDPVEFDFEVAEGAAVATGDTLGWVEGFKAVSDVFAPMDGTFAGTNPELEDDIDLLTRASDRAWLYRLRGTPAAESLDAEGYAGLLDATIDRMLGERGEAP